MTPNTPTVVIGIDVGQTGVDVHMHGSDLNLRFRNTKAGRRSPRDWLRASRDVGGVRTC